MLRYMIYFFCKAVPVHLSYTLRIDEMALNHKTAYKLKRKLSFIASLRET